MNSYSVEANYDVKKLNRYTSIPYLIDMLHRKKLYMPGYLEWEDRNDINIMKVYEDKIKKAGIAEGIRALCFSYEDETIHHWKYFADGSGGCCIEFDAEKLLSSLSSFGNSIIHKKVSYRKANELAGASKIPMHDIPFVKRHPYRIESEYRIISLCDSECVFELDISLEMINRITFNQCIPRSVMNSLVNIIGGNEKIRTWHSTVFENKEFISRIKELAED